MNYQQYGLNLSEGQKRSLLKAIQGKTGIKIKLSLENLSGTDMVPLTQMQINKIEKSMEKNKGLVLNMSKKQLSTAAKMEGGFLPALLMALAAGGASALGSWGMNKLISKFSKPKQAPAQVAEPIPVKKKRPDPEYNIDGEGIFTDAGQWIDNSAIPYLKNVGKAITGKKVQGDGLTPFGVKARPQPGDIYYFNGNGLSLLGKKP